MIDKNNKPLSLEALTRQIAPVLEMMLVELKDADLRADTHVSIIATSDGKISLSVHGKGTNGHEGVTYRDQSGEWYIEPDTPKIMLGKVLGRELEIKEDLPF